LKQAPSFEAAGAVAKIQSQTTIGKFSLHIFVKHPVGGQNEWKYGIYGEG
jgi:hypothetical protein